MVLFRDNGAVFAVEVLFLISERWFLFLGFVLAVLIWWRFFGLDMLFLLSGIFRLGLRFILG